MSELFKPSKRIQFLLDQIPPGSELWDVGCDHGLLGLAAVAHQRVSRSHLVDPALSVIESLKQFLNSPKYSEWWKENEARVQIVRARGEDVVASASGTIVIAGMGGESIVKILERVQNFDKLILNPFSHFEELELCLSERGWTFSLSTVCERQIDYRIYCVEKVPA